MPPSPRLAHFTDRLGRFFLVAKQQHDGRRRARWTARQPDSAPAANFFGQRPYDDMNPHAPPFWPSAGPPDGSDQHGTTHQHAYPDYAAQAQAHAHYLQWAQYYGYIGYPPQNPPYYGAPSAFVQHGQANYPNPATAYHYAHMQSHASPAQGPTDEELHDTFDSLIHRPRPTHRTANPLARASDQELDDFIQKIDGHGPAKQKKKTRERKDRYHLLHRLDTRECASVRVNKPYRAPSEPRGMTAKERRRDPKIALPAPPPTPLYLSQAAEEPSTLDTPGQMLVILDLNGTLIYRPNRNAKSMIARPFLKPFLRYLFSNFHVMVWSSARPHNVDSLVTQCLDTELRSMLVAIWARDSFSLSEHHYNMNVQVYKNLDLVWNSIIQQKHPYYAVGQRFGQHNTVLIDDSSLKANAQPHNLLEVPEFKADLQDVKQDVLREVAGYLEFLRTQADVSKFISKDPFKFDGRWQYAWPCETTDAEGGKLESQVSLHTA
ncbi:HAD-like protein [Dothidotthia symphoricarpi CBS 119687]|uniref:Mitochondrial import inner membrane translocase subunit TIM50 n=1 Tax=Dothidotthia symphoricarpi CBS 119687 TaxID=1392245 RepID=A0A6A6ACX8_9PLEO|nr:HAD-like protein [Dothidotthia symphoricarpi CBS 119687]KAF2128727.1 HAD-like protein [Dothidotthia symphoricarpi CBS 119687]